MEDDDDALSRAHKFLTVVPGRAVARIDNDAIADLLKQADESARPKAPPRPVEIKQARPATEPVREPPRNPPPATVAQPRPAVVAQPQPPAVTPEILPAAAPAPTQGSAGGNPQNITVVVNAPAPAAPYPWWGYWPPPYYGPPPRCLTYACPHLAGYRCGRWLCPYRY